MLKIENTEVLGWEHAIRGMRNPLNSWAKSDSGSCVSTQAVEEGWFEVGPNDLDLMKRLRNAGTDHRKFMRMITVDRAKVNLTVKIRTEGYGPTEHQFPEVSAVIKEG